MPLAHTRPSVQRVLVIAPTPFFGDRGCHVRIYEEVHGLTSKGVDVLVVTYATGRELPDVRTRRSVPLPGVRASALGPSYGRPLLDLLLVGTALRAARQFGPHVIHAHLHEGILIGAMLRRFTGIPLVADLQGSLTAELLDHEFLRGGGLAARLVTRLERWLVRQPDALLVSSAAGLPLLVGQGALPDRVISLPDGVDLQQFRPRAPDESLLTELGLRGKRVVVYLGVLTEYQGVDTLIEAIPEVPRAAPDAHFLIMGYPNGARYRAIIASRGLERWVTLPGRVPYSDVPHWLSLGAVAVSAKRSLTEANGKLLNYMACGLPVIATDTAVNRELLGDDGVYVSVGDSHALATQLAELLQAPDRQRTLGSALRRRAEARFGWAVLAEDLMGVYRRVLGRP